MQDSVLEWLLEKNQPSVRYYTLRELLGRRAEDAEVKRARAKIARTGWAADQLRALGPNGFWEAAAPKNIKQWFFFTYFPKFTATNWRALVLADLGLDSSNAQVRKIASTLFNYRLRLGCPLNYFHEEVSIAGNTARMLARFGYGNDHRVRRLYDWLVEDQREDGGWNAEQGAPGSLEGWQALAAFACVPKANRSTAMQRAISRGAEFYLKRGLFREAGKHEAWFLFHYPNHYFYDILVGLNILTQLGYAGDKRLKPALDILRQKRQSDGTWMLDAVYPHRGTEGKNLGNRKLKPLVIESPARPSKWITLTALRVLKRVENAG